MTVANNTTDLRYGVTGELGCKAPCRGATMTNITLEGEQTANGIAFVANDIALVNGQTNTTENGVYIVSTSAWIRAVWFDDELDAIPGTLVITAGEGTLYPNTIWETICADNPIIFGTSAITFQVKASGTNTGDKIIQLTGNVTGTSVISSPTLLTVATTIANNAVTTAKIADNNVTNAKLAQVATATFKARATAATGNYEDLTATQATALLDVFVGDSGSGGTKGLVPSPAAGDAADEKFLKADGTWEFVPGSGQATESSLGTAKIATQAITDAGTDDLTIVTPLKLKTNKSYYMVIQDQKPNGTDGGASSGGMNIRVLNTVLSNTISGASLASNQITLPAGTFAIDATTPCFGANANKAYLYNVTDSTNDLLGTSNYNVATVGVQSFSRVIGILTIASAKVFELRQYIQTGLGSGLGTPASAGQTEVYSQILIQKIA